MFITANTFLIRFTISNTHATYKIHIKKNMSSDTKNACA